MAERVSVNFFDPANLERKYGSQELYNLRANEAVEEGLSYVQDQIRESKDPEKVFFGLYTLLADRRRLIAVEQNSSNKEEFGCLRLKPEHDRSGFAFTSLTGVYQSVGNTALKRIVRLMDKLKDKKEGAFSQEIWGRKWTFQVEILDSKPGGNFVPILTHPRNYPPYMAECFTREGRLPFRNRAHFLRLHSEDPEIYSRLERTTITCILNAEYPSLPGERRIQRTKHIWATLSMDIDGEKVPLAKFVTGADSHETGASLEQMRKDSIVYVVHQDFLYHEITVVALSRLWGRIVTWKDRQAPLEELQADVAHLRFVFALAMLSYRGDGAIGDWIERIAYQVNGLVFTPAEKTLLPFEPLAAVIPSFYEKDYPKTRSWNS